VGIYPYPSSTASIWEPRAPLMSPGGGSSVPAGDGIASGGYAPVSLYCQRVCRFFAVPLWQRMVLSVWFSQTITGCRYIAAFTFLFPENTTPHIFYSRTLVRDFWIRYCIFCIVVCEISPGAILAIFKARRMLVCFSCT